MHPFTIEHPKTLEHALESLKVTPHAKLIAGGTTLVDLMKLDVENPPHLIDITNLNLNAIEITDNYIKLGALAKMSDVADHPFICENYPALSESLWKAASPQLRNMATIAGNIMQRTRCPYFRDTNANCNKRKPGSGCDALEGENRLHAILGTSEQCIATHPSDFCVALMAFSAEIEICSPEKKRRIQIDTFYRLPEDTPHLEHNISPNEIVTAVYIPITPMGKKSFYLKVRDRESYEFAVTSAAVVVALEGETVKDAKIALGGVGTKPWRAIEVEKSIIGKKLNEANIQKAAQEAFKNAKTTKHNDFKIKLGENTIVEAFLHAAQRGER